MGKKELQRYSLRKSSLGAASYLAMGTAALGGLACTTPVGAVLYLGAEVCAGAAVIYYGAN